MRRALAAALLVLLAGCGAEQEPAAVPGSPVLPPRLVQALRDGGHVLVFRHTTTEPVVNVPDTVGDCGRQRNLTDQGRREAREIGRAIRALDIPVGDVRASPLCRTLETAQGLFGRATEDRRLVSPGLVGTAEDDRRRARQLRRLVDTRPSGRGNTALVTHTGNIGAAFDDESVLEGGALMFRPNGDGTPHLVGRIPPDTWALLTPP